MTTTAKVIQLACETGLVLNGQYEDGTPSWIGNDKQWREFEQKMIGDSLEKLYNF